MSTKVINLFDGVPEKWSCDDNDGLINYLNEVWQNRPLFLSKEDDEEEMRSREQRFFILSDQHIKPRNYVGFVQYGDMRINIYPRVFENHPTIKIEENATAAINHVLKWLSYGNRIHFPFNEVPLHLQSQADWLEALIYLFANYTLGILSSSPYFAYREVTEEMAFVRGRIAMPQYINQNLAKGRHHLLHCIYEPFLYDNQFNRIVKYTCQVLQNVSLNNLNRYLLNDILFILDEVSDVYSTTDDCAKVPVNRLYPEIPAITNMCASFLSNQVYSDGIANNQNLCILLPMEVIYEQYIAGLMIEHFPQLKAKSQASGEYVAKTGKDFSKNVFQMRHDIWLPDNMIIDTKYKFRNSEDENKGGVSQNDIYQMVTYCYKRNMKNGMLLYPMHFDKKASNKSSKFKIEAKAWDIIIDACSIDITEEDFEKFEDEQIEKIWQVLKI